MKPKHKILLVDNNPANTLILEEILQQKYEVKKSITVEKALAILPDFRPDLILLDTEVPAIRGYEACKKIRNLNGINLPKIIMMSSTGSVSERLNCYDVGADDYMVKPFEKEELLAKVRVYLRLKSIEEVDHLKSNLLTFLHHETHTPLNSIIVPVETLLENEDLDAKDRRRWLEMNYHGALRLQSLLEKAMTLCAIKAGQLPFHFENADLCSITRDSEIKVKSKLAERQVTVDLHVPDTAIAHIDREQFTRVLTILLENAVRVTPIGGKVSVSISVDSKHFNLVVADQGMGIHPEYLPFIFDEFSDPDMRYHTQGHGLSLAIAKHIMHAHQGTIDVQSVLDQGSTFIVRVPVIPSAEL